MDRESQTTAQPPVRVGQVWHSEKLNVFDRTIRKVLDSEAVYFDCPSPTWGWISLQDWWSWVRATGAVVVKEVSDAD